MDAVCRSLLVALVLLPSAAMGAHPLEGDAAEQTLLKALARGKYIRAREQAERLLRSRPDSVIVRYALAEVFFEEEANLPRALYQMRLAEKQLTTRYGTAPVDPVAQRWHRKILLREEQILGELDRRRDQLALLDRYDALYQPKQDHRRIWPLMKLHLFEKAAAIARRLTLSSEISERIAGYNGLLSVQFERERPKACYRTALEAVEATGYQSCILTLNAAEAAFAVFDFEAVERLSLKSIQAPIKDCPASAHVHLANLYLLRGDFQRAIAAVKDARAYGVQRRHRQQFEMGINAWLMRLLYALGQFEEAYQLAGRVARAPDRVGLTSFTAEQMELIHTIDLHAAIEAQRERLRERASARPLARRLALWAKRAKLALSSWRARRKAAKLLARGDNLRNLLRPYLKPFPPWRAASLIDIAGEGIVATGVAHARQHIRMKKETAPYFEAWLGEVAYREGDLSRALKMAEGTLARLPRDEVLMRGRVHAWAADAARRLGRAEAARLHFAAALQRWPTPLRTMGIGLPVQIKTGPHRRARRVGELLGASPRLIEGAIGFVVDVRALQRGRGLRLCLSGPRGRRYACAVADLSKADDEAEKMALAVDAFHDEVFAPRIDLTQQDINSLDGSAVRGRADRLLQQVLGE